MKTLLSLIWIILATIPSYLIVSRYGRIPPHALLVASAISFSIFAATKRLQSIKAQMVVGVISSYLAFLGLTVLPAVYLKNFADIMMWLPVTIIFGVPIMAPLVVLSWIGATIFFGLRKKQQTADIDGASRKTNKPEPGL